jgi:hypothetical protein
MKKYIFLLCVLTLFSCDKKDEPGGEITKPGASTSDKPKGDIPPLSVRYDLETGSLSWQRLPDAEVYDIYVREKDRGDYVLLTSVAGDTLSTTQSFDIIRFLDMASKPKGLYHVKLIGRNALKKGDLAVAAETEVDFSNEFPPLTGMRYNPETFILSWKQPSVYATDYFIYVKKEGDKEYVNILSFFSTYGRIDIIAELKALGFGTYHVKIVGHNIYAGLKGNIEKATSVTIEYPDITPPPMTVLSVTNKAITWSADNPKWRHIRFYVKREGEADSAYRLTTVYDYPSSDTQFSIYADYVIKHSICGDTPTGTYIFKATANDIEHGWYGSLEKATPVAYHYGDTPAGR